ncbi:MAG: phosphoglycerate mutase family protein [Alphaproteobacteria bacterium]|nr:phosphoglycerate mutase family protein [Alphaproteobacteria bacterium]
MVARYLSHPQVQIDATVPVPQWGLSDIGKDRVKSLCEAGWLSATTQIVSSSECKAVETAEPIAEALDIAVEIRAAMHENDRSATGFLSPDIFEQVADRFFAEPEQSVRGWERAIDAQRRIVREVETVLNRKQPGDVLFVGHGGVGTLLLCHLAGYPIDRTHDQPAGGGNFFSFEQSPQRLLHPWQPMEQAP